jgi:hypothetical protein
MTRPHLAPCAACARHVRVSEEACPFCGVPLAASMRASAPPRGPAMRLTRAALFAFGALGASAVAATAAAGCGTTTQNGLYGGPAIDFTDGGDESDATYAPQDGSPGIEPDAGDAAVVGQDAGYGSPGIAFDDAETGAGDAALDSGNDSGRD